MKRGGSKNTGHQRDRVSQGKSRCCNCRDRTAKRYGESGEEEMLKVEGQSSKEMGGASRRGDVKRGCQNCNDGGGWGMGKEEKSWKGAESMGIVLYKLY